MKRKTGYIEFAKKIKLVLQTQLLGKSWLMQFMIARIPLKQGKRKSVSDVKRKQMVNTVGGLVVNGQQLHANST